MLNTLGAVVTVAGSSTGNAGFVDGLGSYARFNAPWGLSTGLCDSYGSCMLYVADSQNNCIRMLNTLGVVRNENVI
jgi:hypothetical protein